MYQANLFCKRQDILTSSGFMGHTDNATTELCHCSTKAARENTQMNKHGCVPIKLHIWILRYEFHILFWCHEVLFFFWFCFNHLKKWKSFLVCRPFKTRHLPRFGFQAIVGQSLKPWGYSSGRNRKTFLPTWSLNSSQGRQTIRN